MQHAAINMLAPMNPKLARLSGDAFRVWVFGLVYAQVHRTDGRIPLMVVPLLGLPQPQPHYVEELVVNNLWLQKPECFLIKDYLDWNRSALERNTFGRNASRRQRAYRERHRPAASVGGAATPAAPEAQATARSARPDPPARPQTDTSRYAYVSPRLQIPRAFHLELCGRYGADAAEADRALLAWYPTLVEALRPDEAISGVFTFMNARFAAWVAGRTKTPTPRGGPVTPIRTAAAADIDQQIATARRREALRATGLSDAQITAQFDTEASPPTVSQETT